MNGHNYGKVEVRQISDTRNTFHLEHRQVLTTNKRRKNSFYFIQRRWIKMAPLLIHMYLKLAVLLRIYTT
jgi:hypothetical protein